MESDAGIMLVSKDGTSFTITMEQANTSGLLRRMLLDKAVNCRREVLPSINVLPGVDVDTKQNLSCNCYRCESSSTGRQVVIFDRISASLLQKVCEFMSYKIRTEELISTTMSSTAPSKIRDLCARLDGFSIGDDSGEILDLLVVADYLDI